jgi:hypothetical protein
MREALVLRPAVLWIALLACAARAQEPRLVVQAPAGDPAPQAIQRVERVMGPEGVPRYRIWPPEMIPAISESMGIPLDRIEAGKPPEVAARVAAAPRAPRSEDTPETVLYHDHCRALDERGVGRGEEVGGLAAIGVRLGGKGQAGEIGEAEPEVRLAIDEWNERGALVVSVVPGAPADLAGIVAGDIIVRVESFWIDTPATFIRLVSRAEVGEELELQVLRRGQVERAWVTPIDRKEMEALQR